MTLHELELAQKLADAVVCVAPSGVSGVLTPQEAFAEQNIRRLFDLTAEQYAMLFKMAIQSQSLSTISAAGKAAALRLTTGTCAALGAAGAARLLLTGHVPESVGLRTPKGIVDRGRAAVLPPHGGRRRMRHCQGRRRRYRRHHRPAGRCRGHAAAGCAAHRHHRRRRRCGPRDKARAGSAGGCGSHQP